MNRTDVEDARSEAVRFIARCDTLLAATVDAWNHKERRYEKRKWLGTDQSPSADAATVRRSSLDLTRALARMRKRGGS